MHYEGSERRKLHQVEMTQMVTLFLKASTEVIVYGDEVDQNFPEARVQRAVEEIREQMAQKLDKFILTLGQPQRFEEKSDSPIYAIWRFRDQKVLTRITERDIPTYTLEPGELRSGRFLVEQEILDEIEKKEEE